MSSWEFSICGTSLPVWFVILFGLGALIRMAVSVLYGTQDVEWWKAWIVYCLNHGVTSIYGGNDTELARLTKEHNISWFEAYKGVQSKIHYRGYNYAREEYPYHQPPLYIYGLFLVGKLYQLIDKDLTNNRRFNVIVNIIPNACALGITVLIFHFFESNFSLESALIASLIFWLNPLVLLNTPVQGYWDVCMALPALASLVSMYHGNLILAYLLVTISVLVKPQGVLIVPVVFSVGLFQFPLITNLAAIGASLALGILIFLPFILTGRGITAVIGIASIGFSSQDLSRQAYNFWWILQYGANAVKEIKARSASDRDSLLGGNTGWFLDYPAQRIGLPVQAISRYCIVLFTVANICYANSVYAQDRNIIFVAAFLQVYGYFILRVGVQGNHYFAMLPILCIMPLLDTAYTFVLITIVLVFFLQDFIHYGFGRDYNPGIQFLSNHRLGWTTVLISMINTLFFLLLCCRLLLGMDITFSNFPLSFPGSWR